MKHLRQTIEESLIKEGKDWVIYVPCEDPDEIEEIYNLVTDEFSDVDVATDDYVEGDPSLKCYVFGENESKVKKFSKMVDADYEEN